MHRWGMAVLRARDVSRVSGYFAVTPAGYGPPFCGHVSVENRDYKRVVLCSLDLQDAGGFERIFQGLLWLEELVMAKNAARSEETRNEAMAEQRVTNLLLMVIIGGVVLWLAPQSRMIAGVPLVFVGRVMENIGQKMLDSSPDHGAAVVEASAQPGPGDLSWLIGFGILISPFVVTRLVYVQGWLTGTKETSNEWRERTPYLR